MTQPHEEELMAFIIQCPAARFLATTFLSLSLSLTGASMAQAQQAGSQAGAGAGLPMRDELRQVAPGLERYGQQALLGNLWQRPDLSPRDRSIVTLAALIARNQTAEMMLL
jgi:4-carboxymuconolactone decarboxylase